MSLHPTPIGEIPTETARVAKAAFPKGTLVTRLRDEFAVLFEDADFRALYPRQGQPGLAPWRLALVTVFQFLERLSDRQAADAVRARIDWKYALGLELTDPGFDHSVLCEFRSRLTVQFYFTQKAVGASTALLESSLQYPTGEKDPETQEPTYTPTEPPETDSKSGPWGDEEEPIIVPTFEPSASGGGTEELAKEETGYFTEVEIKEETGNE